jgi:hypothetical protein
VKATGKERGYVGRKNLEIFENLIAGTISPGEQSGILLPPPI